VGGTIVWMTVGPDGEPIEDEFGTVGVEAVAIEKFLGKYDLVRVVD